MSYEPDTSDNRIRQLKEEIAKIREERFFQLFPINESSISSTLGGSSGTGTGLPNVGTSANPPQTINTTLDTAVIEKLNFKNKSPTKDFTIGEIITGNTSGATAEIGDIDFTGSDTGILILVPNTLVGSFTDNENLNGNIGGTNIAKADGTEYTTVGRGHLNVRATSIIANGTTSTFELHYLDDAISDGQTIHYLRPKTGQTMIIRRPLTSDGTTGNFDVDTTITVRDNQLIGIQFQRESNVTPDGGWLIVGTGASGSSTLSGINFPILYPKESIGPTSGVINLLLNQSNGHFKQITLDGDASLTFSNLPPSTNGFELWVWTIQDGTGGHVYTGLPSSVVNSATLLSQLQTGAGVSTLWHFVTADGGATWHSEVVTPTSSSGGSDTPWTVDHDANTFDLFNIDKLRFAPAGGFNFPVDNSVKGISTSGTGLEFNIPSGGFASYRYYIGGVQEMALDSSGIDLFDNGIGRVLTIGFTGFGSYDAFIASDTFNSELKYNTNGPGSHHAFYIDNAVNANMEIRLNVNKSNVNLDLVTNDIINLDQAQFTQTGGFVSSINHGERRITGGNVGINMNIPKISPGPSAFRVWFENSGLTDSNLKYEFTDGLAKYFNNAISDLGGITFTFGHAISPLATHLEYSASVGTVHQFKIGAGLPIIEFNDTETGTNQGKIKLFHDLNLQTQDINNVDRLHFNSNNGIVGGNQVAIAGLGTDMQLNIPLNRSFSFKENNTEFMNLSEGLLKMNFVFGDPRIQAHQFELITHTLGSGGILDGMIRLVNNSGQNDIMIGTGGTVINLSAIASGNQTPWTSDINANTFNLFNLDVLRYAVDSGVIGAGQYGSAVDATNTKLKWSVPLSKFYEWQHNLDRIATLSSSSFYMRSNPTITHPSIITDGSFLFGATHTSGVTGMIDGESRLVNNSGSLDVIFRSGGINVNLTTLSAGGGDNLGNHTATQPLNMANNPITNFLGWTSANGSESSGGAGTIWNVITGREYFWNINNITQMNLTPTALNFSGGLKKITNVADPTDPQDVATRAFVLANTGSVDTSANFIWTGNHNFNGTLLTIGNASSDVLTINSRINSNLDPISDNAFTLGTASRRWQSLFVSGNSTLGPVTFNGVATHLSTINMSNFKITNLGTPTLPADAVTKAYVDSLGGVSLSANNTWTGTQTFNDIVVADSTPVFVAGSIASSAISNGGAVTLSGSQTIGGNKTFSGTTFRHTGSQLGFYGVPAVSRQTAPPFLGGGATLTDVRNALNSLRASIITLGLLQP